MTRKKCFKCRKVKALGDFYKHKRMGDGHLNKCKACTRDDVRAHRDANIERIREYDRQRGNRQTYEYVVEYRKKHPNKYRAHTLINNAIRDGKLFREPCEICKKEEGVHAHHDDYLRPLNVRWLCPAHHKQWHRDNGEALNP